MLPEEDRRALRKNGYNISPKGVISPIAHPLQTYNRKTSSSEVQLYRQGERNPRNNSPRPQPKPTPTASNTRRYGSADAAERWSKGASPQPKPTPTPTALNTRRYGSADAAERWSKGSSPQPKPTPTPTVSNNRRYGSADAAQRWNGGTSPQPQLTTAPWRNQYANNRPLTPPPASEPPKPEPKKSWWDKAGDFVKEKTSDAWDKTKSVGTFVKDHASEIGHGALDVAGFVPVVGAAADLANAGWYLAQGDKVNAALSATSAIPIAGDALAAGKLGFKAVKGTEKLVEAGTTVSKATKVTDKGVEGVASIGKKYTFDTTNIGATPGKPLTSHQKKKAWRAMAEDSKAPLTDAQRDHIRTTPGHKSPAPSWHNPVTGKKEIMELSHEGNTFSKEVEEVSSRRAGGTDVVPRWPETHAQIDKHRHLARNVREVYTSPDGIDKVRRAFAKEVKEWGYKVDDSKL